MTTWTRFYRTKQAQKNRAKGMCENCGQFGSTQSHHLFLRRNPNHRYLWHAINIVQLCHKCHYAETLEMQTRMATKKLDEYGPDKIEAWVANAPFKMQPRLPSHYLGAKTIWEIRQKGEGKSV